MNKHQVEVSLILCGYNAESTMEKSLDSAVAQTLDSLEILCINDGSTDRTSEIFHSYAGKDSRIKVIDHPVNKGLLAARQTGVNHASGKYIMFLDLDDALVPEACLELAGKMDETGSDLIQFDTELTFATEELRLAQEKAASVYFALKRTKMLCDSDDIIKACFLEKEFPWNVWSKIYKTRLARQVYSFVPEKKKVVMAEDAFAFFLAASMANKLVFVNKKYYVYSIGVGVSGNTDLRKTEESLDVFYRLIKPYADKYSTAVGRQAAENLGKEFRQCMIYKLSLGDLIDSYQVALPREIGKFGLETEALSIAENWDLIGCMHPLKSVFLVRFVGSFSKPAKKIRNIGVICIGSKISPSGKKCIDFLRDAGYEIQLIAKDSSIQTIKDSLSGYRIQTFPDARADILAFWADSSIQKQNDAYMLLYDTAPDYDFVTFLLWIIHFVCQKNVFACLEKEIGRLNCHDKIFLSAVDCVLSDSPEISPLFGDIGVLVPTKEPAGQLREVISAFERKSDKDRRQVLSIRKCMKTTGEKASAALGYAGFGNHAPLDREKLKQKIAAAGAPISVEDYCLVRESGFFDDEYYRKQFPGCIIEDPILHYCTVGFCRLAAPSAIFDSKLYYLANSDIFPDLNPLVHYLRHGIYEHRNIYFPVYDLIRDSGYFDGDFYRQAHEEELGSLDPLTHYLLVGWKKGYLPSDQFVDQDYRKLYFDLADPSLNPLSHYICWGKKEGRCSFPLHPRWKQYFPEGYDTEAFWRRKEKYLIVVHQLDFTGVPILSKMVAEIFSGEKSAAMISPMDGPLCDTCLKAGIPVLVDSDFYVNTERISFYKENGFSICLFNTLGLIQAFLRTSGIIPSILWVHDNIPRGNLPVSIQRRIECAPTVFATSKTTREVVREYNPGVRYMPYPVKDLGRHHKTVVPDKIRFGVFGTYIDRKGQDLVIAAFKNLPAKLKAKAELLLIGNAVLPEYAEKLESMALGEEHIHFIPAKNDADAYHLLYENLEVQICPSRTDPMPLVVFDGMMHGCPEILSDTVGQSEFIRNGENGYVFQSGNVTALRDCMVRILEEPERFVDMSRAIRQTFLDNTEFTKASGIIRRVLDEVKTYL